MNFFDHIRVWFLGVDEAAVNTFIRTLNDVFNSLGKDIDGMVKVLTTDWSTSAIGTWSRTFFNDITYPLGLTLLSLFFIIGYTKRAAMFKMNSFEGILKVILQLFFAKMIMENAMNIMNFIFSNTSNLVDKVAATAINSTDIIDFNSSKAEWMKMTGWEFSKMTNRFWPLQMGMFFIKLLINGICFGRLIEVYLFTIVAPIPLATIASEEYSQIGKKFFQHYISVCLQGLIIVIILKFFPLMVAAITFSGITIDVWGVLAISFTLGLLLFRSGNIATKLTGG